MSKQTNAPKSGAATTNSKLADLSVRDVIRTMKKNQKAIKVLQKVGANKAGIKEAIVAIGDEQGKLKNLAMQAVAKQIEMALADDEE